MLEGDLDHHLGYEKHSRTATLTPVSGRISTRMPSNHGETTGRNSPPFDFPLEIRLIVYTTNLIENLNGKIMLFVFYTVYCSKKFFCHSCEACIGKMYTINGCFAIITYQVITCQVVYVFISTAFNLFVFFF